MPTGAGCYATYGHPHGHPHTHTHTHTHTHARTHARTCLILVVECVPLQSDGHRCAQIKLTRVLHPQHPRVLYAKMSDCIGIHACTRHSLWPRYPPSWAGRTCSFHWHQHTLHVSPDAPMCCHIAESHLRVKGSQSGLRQYSTRISASDSASLKTG